jgi:hypothetical protein
MTVLRILATPPEKPSWTDRLEDDKQKTWLRLERLLRDGGRWKPDQVASLAFESFRVLRH